MPTSKPPIKLPFRIGQSVRLRTSVGDPPAPGEPGSLRAVRGDIVVIRSINHPTNVFPLCVSHPDADTTDPFSLFGVKPQDIEALE